MDGSVWASRFDVNAGPPKLLKFPPHMLKMLFKLRLMGTYDLEGGFSTLVMMVGFKPALRIALGVPKRASNVTTIKLRSGRGFRFNFFRGARYDHPVDVSSRAYREAK